MRFLLLAAVLILAGCANPYKTFYRGQPHSTALENALPRTEPLRVYSTTDVQRDARELRRQGFSWFGSSSFRGAMGMVSEQQLREQAEALGAHIVLAAGRYTNTVTGALPIATPTTSTAVHTGQATAYGPGGSVTAFGSGTTTTFGTQTTYVPFAVDQGEFGAAYFVKVRTRLGVYVGPLDDATRRALGSNAGLLVDVVVNGSPAFVADILPGDVIRAVNGREMLAEADFRSAIQSSKVLELQIVRGTSAITKTVELLSP